MKIELRIVFPQCVRSLQGISTGAAGGYAVKTVTFDREELIEDTSLTIKEILEREIMPIL